MRTPITTAVAASVIAAAVCACAPPQPSVQAVPGETSASLGAIQLDVREETRLTEGVNGATVELVPASKEDWRAPLREVTADSSGRVVLAALAPERYAIRVWAAGHDTVTQRITVTAGKIEALRIKLRDDHCTPLLTGHGPVCM
jgi:hypothetical protein